MSEIRVVRASSSVAVGDEPFNYIVLADTSSADVAITLLSPTQVFDRYIAIRNTGDNYVSVTAAGSKTINESTDAVPISPATGLLFLVDDVGNFHSFDPFTVGGQITDYDAGTHSYQSLPIDLNLASTVGSSSDPKYIAAIMTNLLGDSLTKTKPYLASLIGKLSITGARATTYPLAAIAAEVGDGVTQADGSFLAVLGGDSALTNARAAFTVDNQNTTPNSGFQFGLDLAGPGTHDGYPAVVYTDSDIRFSNGLTLTLLTTAITANVTTTTKAAGNMAITSNATGRGHLFFSDGTRWQNVV